MTGALDLFQAALAYAARDWPVFPCSPATKAPLIRAWRKRASTNPETIKAWWYRWPQAMIGLPTGRPTGVFVVDIDPGEAASAEAILGELERLVGPLPPGPRVRTPGVGCTSTSRCRQASRSATAPACFPGSMFAALADT